MSTQTPWGRAAYHGRADSRVQFDGRLTTPKSAASTVQAAGRLRKGRSDLVPASATAKHESCSRCVKRLRRHDYQFNRL